ncbi:MAG: hypothetical protein JEZ07_00790 [Phycisphaerae bacterium]|nr:hypothetical protein [Phycisphaerae bacterium]
MKNFKMYVFVVFKRVLPIFFIMVLINGARLTLAVGSESISATDIALKMIEANSKAQSFKGSFTRIIKTNAGENAEENIKKRYEALIEGGALSTGEKDKMRKAMLIRIEQVKNNNGYTVNTERYEGVIDRKNNRYSYKILDWDSTDKYLPVTYVCDGEKTLVFSEIASHAVVDWENTANSNMIKNDLHFTSQWAGLPNRLYTSDKVSIVETTSFEGKSAIVIKQEPTDFSLGLWDVYHTVIPEMGYMSVKTEYRHPENNCLIRKIEAFNIQQLHEGVYRPLRWVDITYKMLAAGKSEIDVIEEVEFDDSSIVLNPQVSDSFFDVRVPRGISRIIDKTVKGKPLDIEVPDISAWQDEGFESVKKYALGEKEIETKQLNPDSGQQETVDEVAITKDNEIESENKENFDMTLLWLAFGILLLLFICVVYYKKQQKEKL